ncbi:hypothetical protein GCM10022235_85680 [Kribbella ginsengisoli]|uniref:Uncharacterized protein n=1 Tax=Kribbella ginsengisoli TaxID=363865 RepID=A0ABP6ZAA4_9ACTN
MTETAPKRAAPPYLRITDQSSCCRKRGAPPSNLSAHFEPTVPCQGSQAHRRVKDTEPSQLLDGVDVNHEAWADVATIEHWHKALPTRQYDMVRMGNGRECLRQILRR